jgi:hypothetical protein
MKILLNGLLVILLAILLNVGFEYYKASNNDGGGVRVERNIMKNDINAKIAEIESQGGEVMEVQVEDQMNVDTYTIIYKK